MARAEPAEGKERSISTGEAVVIALLLLVIAGMFVFIYNGFFPQQYRPSWDAAQLSRELVRNRAKWESHHVTHYRMMLVFAGYGIGDYDRMPLTVEVQGETAISALDAKGKPWIPGNRPLTITGLFSFVYSEMGDKPAGLSIRYDPALGYPVEIYVDPWTEPCCQDYWYTVQDLVVLP